MLELARAVAARPKLLLLDEVMAGLRPSEGDQIVAAIKELHASGLTVLLIEHVMRVVMALAQRVVVFITVRKSRKAARRKSAVTLRCHRELSRQEGQAWMSAILKIKGLEVSPPWRGPRPEWRVTSPSRPAVCSRSSVPTAPARRRWCARSGHVAADGRPNPLRRH